MIFLFRGESQFLTYSVQDDKVKMDYTKWVLYSRDPAVTALSDKDFTMKSVLGLSRDGLVRHAFIS